MSCELSSFNPWTTFGFDLTQLDSYNPNVTQTINTELSIPNADIDVTVSPSTVNVIPIVVPSFSSVEAQTSTEQMSSSEMMSLIDMCYTSMMMSSMTPVMSSTVSSSYNAPTTSFTVPTTTVISTVTQTLTSIATTSICPSSSTLSLPSSTTNSVPVSISTTTVYVSTTSTTTTYVPLTTTTTETVSNCTVSGTRNTTITSTVGTDKPPSKPDGLSQELSIPGGAIYFGIAGFVIAIIVILIFSICCCLFCYHKGHRKGQSMEIRLHKEIEMSANNPLYDAASDMDSVSFRSSVDEKQLLQYIQ